MLVNEAHKAFVIGALLVALLALLTFIPLT